MRRAATAAAITVVALTAAACGAVAEDPREAADAPGRTTSPGAGIPPASSSTSGEHPLDFASVTTDSDPFDAAALAGEDVVLWFWTPWCTICRAEAPQVAAAAAQVESVEVIGVASSGPLEDMQAFVSDTGTEDLTHVADIPGEVWNRFDVISQPTFVFVDDDGRTQTFAGGLSQAALVDAMRQLEDA